MDRHEILRADITAMLFPEINLFHYIRDIKIKLYF